MITFHDGPAKGASLLLQRAPDLLRVVIDQDGTIDALDQVDDEPKPTESIYVYRIVGKASAGFMCRRGRGGRGCQRFACATYKLSESQPEPLVARDAEKWREWCRIYRRQESS